MATTPVPQIPDRATAEAFLDARIGHGVKPGLERIAGLLEFLGDPQASYPTVHIAGTNGKTTVSRMVQQILGAHGLATGGFTSPHLDAVEERFALHGAPVTPDELTDAVRDIAWFVVGYEAQAETSVTYFEVTTALAFVLMANAAVDVGVVEVGLGGRWDATNVITADVCVITGVDLDHQEFLGDTVGAIAAEKVAILDEGGTLVTGPLTDDARGVVAERVESTSSRWMRYGSEFSVLDAIVGVGGWQCSIEGVFDQYPDLFLPLHGRHQVDHLSTAIATCEMFLGRALDRDAVAVAAASMTSPGRLEVVARRPIVILDGAHNPQGFAGLAATLDEEFPPLGWHLVIGLRGNRSIPDLVSHLRGQVASVVATAADDPASHDPTELASAIAAVLDVPTSVVPGPLEALAAAKEAAGAEGGVVVTGSLYVVGEVRRAFDVPDDRSLEAHVRYEAPVDPDDEFEGEQDPFPG